MKKYFYVLLVVAFFSTQLFSFKVAFFADARGNMPLGINGPILAKIVAQVEKVNPDAIVCAGDLYTGSKNVYQYKEQVENFLSYIKPLTKFDIFFSKGNHEGKKEWQDKIYRENFKAPKGAICLKDPSLYPMVFYKEYKDVVIFSLNCEAPGYRHRFSDSQIKFLVDNAKKFKDKLIIVAAHEPAFPYGPHKGSSLDKYPKLRDFYWKTFKDVGVAIYNCGHEHLYNDKVVDGILQLLTGSCGAPLYSASADAKFYHWALMDYNPDTRKATFSIFDENGKLKKKFVFDIKNRTYTNIELKKKKKEKELIPLYINDKH